MIASRVAADERLRGRLESLYLDGQFDGTEELQVLALLQRTAYLGRPIGNDRIGSGKMGRAVSSLVFPPLRERDRAEIEQWLERFGPDHYLPSPSPAR